MRATLLRGRRRVEGGSRGVRSHPFWGTRQFEALIGLTRSGHPPYVPSVPWIGGSATDMQASHAQYRVGDVVKIIGISRRQLHYWDETDLVRPGTRTPGGHARYGFEDLVALRTAKRLIDAGVSVQRIRSSIRALRRMLPSVRRPLAEVVLVATGDVVLAFRDGTAFEAVSGQEWVFEIAQLQREVDAFHARSGPTPALDGASPAAACESTA